MFAAAFREILTSDPYGPGRTLPLRVTQLEERDQPAYLLPGLDLGLSVGAGEDPRNGPGQITSAELRQRIEAAAPFATSLRTYDVGPDTQEAGSIIHQLGKQAVITAWIGPDPPPTKSRSIPWSTWRSRGRWTSPSSGAKFSSVATSAKPRSSSTSTK